MDATFWQAVITAVFVLSGVVYTQRQLAKASERTTNIESKKVDAEAYDRARKFDQETVDGIKEELTRAKSEIQELRSTLDKERNEHFTETMNFRRQIRRLEDTIDRLRNKLRNAGIDVGDDEDYTPETV